MSNQNITIYDYFNAINKTLKMLELISVITFGFLGTYVFLKYQKASLSALFLKITTTFSIIVFALIATYLNALHIEFSLVVICSLILGLLGDFFLDLKLLYKSESDTFTFAGFYSFILGHLVYIVYFLYHYPLIFRDFIYIIGLSILVVLFVILTEKPSKLNYGRFKVISCFYAFVLSFIMFLSLYLGFTFNEKYLVIFGIGMVLFLFSDLVLSHSYFGEEKKWMIIANYILYYGAQYLIAYSIIY